MFAWCLKSHVRWPSALRWQQRRMWGPAALLLWNNRGCITRFSHYTAGLWCCLCLAHKIHTSYRSLSSHTNTFTPVPFSFPASERLHSPAYRLKPALTVLAQLTHTLSRGRTPLWNNYSLNWQLINLKSIWPCSLTLRFRAAVVMTPRQKADGGMEGEEKGKEGWWEIINYVHASRKHLLYVRAKLDCDSVANVSVGLAC